MSPHAVPQFAVSLGPHQAQKISTYPAAETALWQSPTPTLSRCRLLKRRSRIAFAPRRRPGNIIRITYNVKCICVAQSRKRNTGERLQPPLPSSCGLRRSVSRGNWSCGTIRADRSSLEGNLVELHTGGTSSRPPQSAIASSQRTSPAPHGARQISISGITPTTLHGRRR